VSEETPTPNAESPKPVVVDDVAGTTTALPEQKVALDDECIKIMAEKMGVSEDDIRAKEIAVSPDFITKLKAGQIQFVKQPVPPEQLQQMQAAQGGRVPQPLSAQRPSPRQTLEQRFYTTMRKAEAMKQTSNLPQSVVGRAVDPGNATETAEILPPDQRPVMSAFMENNQRLNKRVLSIRPAGAPNILQEVRTPVKLFVSQHQSPGDLLMLSRAVDDLHKSYPGKFITCMRTPAHQLWEHNPNHTHIDDKDPDAMWIAMEYKLVNTSNRGAHHFGHGFRKDFEAKLGLPIDQTHPHGAIYLGDQEKAWFSQIYEIVGRNVPFWIVDAGRKSDYTAKHWEVARFQEVVDRTPDITWVQVGAKTKGHVHPELKGDNVINLVGKTNIRQFVRLMYHAAGVLTPVSFPMHLAAAVEMHPRYKRQTRPCIVIAGGREPAMWEAYTPHQYLHTCGMLPCCSHGGCWKARVEPLLDGDDKDYDDPHHMSLCERPVVAESGQVIPKCMDLITADEVVTKVRMYMDSYDFSDEDSDNWKIPEFEKPPGVQAKIAEAVKNREELRKKRYTPEQAPASQPENTDAPKMEEGVKETSHAPPEDEVIEEVQPESGATPEDQEETQ